MTFGEVRRLTVEEVAAIYQIPAAMLMPTWPDVGRVGLSVAAAAF